jgi:salicylate hydroxylase
MGVWNEPADLGELRKEYAGWEETVRELLSVARSVHKWKIGVVPDLPRWRSESGRVVLLGDAAHATMPYTAQVCSCFLKSKPSLGGARIGC